MPIDLANVDWLYVAVLTVFACLASLIGNFLSIGHRGLGAVLTALVFMAIFVAWTYYPHGLPLPTSLTQKAPVAAAPPAAAVTPQRPRNPVTDVTPQVR